MNVENNKTHPIKLNNNSKTNQHPTDGSWYNGEFTKFYGLNWFLATLFIVGTLAGGALVSLPSAMVMVGVFPGILLTLIFGILFCYATVCLGRSWCIIQSNYKEYETFCRSPYMEIAYRASGNWFRKITIAIFYINQFGTSIVFLLLASKNAWALLKVLYLTNISFCGIILIMGLLTFTMILFRSPVDFWGIALFAMLSTAFVSLFIIIGSEMDHSKCSVERSIPNLSYTNLFLSIGIISYAYGGGASLSNVQHDMKRPSEFTFSAIIGFVIIIIFYIPVEIVTYYTYGDSLRYSVLDSIQTVPIQCMINLCIGVHCLLVFVINLNPLLLHLELSLSIPNKLKIKRIILRFLIVSLIILIALTVPTFGPIMNLLGGSTMMLTSLIIPVFMYTCLKARQKMIKKDRKYLEERPSFSDLIKHSSLIDTIICCAIVIFGIISMIFITISSVHALLTTHYAPPCFLSFLDNNVLPKEHYLAHTNCCGHYQNVTSFHRPKYFCTAPQLEFYKTNIFTN
uniref:Aa_trans domain-containing protein n=1 Tax=Parastrongyloides trichosuri TaxID=131310 RepID=A0A0N4ZTG1_PARTI